MDSRTLANRLQGAIAGCLLEEGLLFSGAMVIFSPHNVHFIGVIAIQTLIGGWLFFDRWKAVKLALICKAFLCGSALKYVLSPHSYSAASGIDKRLLVFWLIAILEGVQVVILFWIGRLKRRLTG